VNTVKRRKKNMSSFTIPTLFELGNGNTNGFQHVSVVTTMAAYFARLKNPLEYIQDDVTAMYDDACDELVMRTQYPATVDEAIQMAPHKEQLRHVESVENVTVGQAVANLLAQTSSSDDTSMACVLVLNQGKEAVCIVGKDAKGFVVLDPAKNCIYSTHSPEYGVANLAFDTPCDLAVYAIAMPQEEGEKVIVETTPTPEIKTPSKPKAKTKTIRKRRSSTTPKPKVPKKKTSTKRTKSIKQEAAKPEIKQEIKQENL